MDGFIERRFTKIRSRGFHFVDVDDFVDFLLFLADLLVSA